MIIISIPTPIDSVDTITRGANLNSIIIVDILTLFLAIR